MEFNINKIEGSMKDENHILSLSNLFIISLNIRIILTDLKIQKAYFIIFIILININQKNYIIYFAN